MVYTFFIMTNQDKTFLLCLKSKDVFKAVSEQRKIATVSLIATRAVNMVVWYQNFDITDTAANELYGQLIGMTRQEKNELITAGNPEWADIYHLIE